MPRPPEELADHQTLPRPPAPENATENTPCIVSGGLLHIASVFGGNQPKLRNWNHSPEILRSKISQRRQIIGEGVQELQEFLKGDQRNSMNIDTLEISCPILQLLNSFPCL
jgi:hypothetical protein